MVRRERLRWSTSDILPTLRCDANVVSYILIRLLVTVMCRFFLFHTSPNSGGSERLSCVRGSVHVYANEGMDGCHYPGSKTRTYGRAGATCGSAHSRQGHCLMTDQQVEEEAETDITHRPPPPLEGQVGPVAAVPVNLAMVQIAPEHLVGGHVHVQGHGVLQRRNHLGVLALEQVDAPDLVAVGEHQVGALSCRGQQRGVCCLDLLMLDEVGRNQG